MSVKQKLLGAFFIAVLAAVLLGLSSLVTTQYLGDLTVRMFDRPLMAINFSRSAQTVFATMERVDREARGSDAASATLAFEEIERLGRIFEEDLAVAERRSSGPQIGMLVKDIREEVSRWRGDAVASLKSPSDAHDATALAIRRELETLTQIAAEEGFLFRRNAATVIEQTRLWTIAFIVFVLIVCAMVAVWLARDIALPVDLMARSMTRLAGGEREVAVPFLKRGDEIGNMAKSLGVFKTAMFDVEEARARAEAATRAKSEFLAMMSHEVRTPMNGVLGMARLLLETRLNETQRNYARILIESASSLLTVLNDILDFSKLEAGKLDFAHADFDLRRLVESVVSLMEPRAAEKKIEIAAFFDPVVPRYLKGDSDRLRQVLLNLTGNAVKFTDQGRVSIGVEGQGGSGGGVRLRFVVKDTGLGIAKEAQAKLFSGFTQADSSISRRFGGTGLGLAISRKIVDLMGGEMGLDSELGSGSTFWFGVTLPIGTPPRVGPTPAPVRLRPLRILLAEDNLVNQKVVLGHMVPAGHTVDVVPNGRAAIEALRERTYDVVLMDMHMPEMDGTEATRMIRTFGGDHANVPIVAVTAGAMADEIRRCLDSGMNDYVVKPIHPGALTAALARVLGESAAAPPAEESLVDRLLSSADILDDTVIGLLESQLGADVVQSLVMDYLDAADRVIAEIDHARRAGDAEAWGRAAHSLKSVAGGLGLARVFQSTLAIEDACQAGDLDRAGIQTQALLVALSEGRAQLLERHPARTGSEPEN